MEVTTAEPGFAAELVAALASAGYSASSIVLPSGNADAVLLTEGLASQDTTSRHWSALLAANKARREGAAIVLLQGTGAASGLEGLSRTLRKEWPGTNAFAWTLPFLAPDDVAAALKAGFGDGVLSSPGTLMAPQAGAPVSPPATLDNSKPGVWLVTGGARGVTAACAIELARRAGGTILLAGRSPEMPWLPDVPATDDIKVLRGALVQRSKLLGERVSPNNIDRTARSLLAGAEIRATLDAIKHAGATAEYVPLDVGDASEVARTLAALQRSHGTITGWVHGAGVLADRLAADKTEAELRRVFAPKVGGLENILSALSLPSLRHIAFFSSAAAFFGNRGQSDYAMANAILADAGRSLARTLPEARVKVFHWGPWAGGMVDGALASHFEAQGIPLIPVDEGARIFTLELLGGAHDQVELVVGEAWAAA